VQRVSILDLTDSSQVPPKRGAGVVTVRQVRASSARGGHDVTVAHAIADGLHIGVEGSILIDRHQRGCAEAADVDAAPQDRIHKALSHHPRLPRVEVQRALLAKSNGGCLDVAGDLGQERGAAALPPLTLRRLLELLALTIAGLLVGVRPGTPATACATPVASTASASVVGVIIGVPTATIGPPRPSAAVATVIAVIMIETATASAT
jgi:hypothetical protein